MAIHGQKSINGRVEWLGVPVLFCDTGVAWNDNLMVPEACWGDGVRVGGCAWGNQPGVLIEVDILWRGVIPAYAAYLPRSPPENARTSTRCVRDAHLQEHYLVRDENHLYAHHIGGDEWVFWCDDNWDNLLDEPADQ